MPWNETLIEVKHQRVTMRGARQVLGPVKVSMSNRMELFRKLCKRYGKEFLNSFAVGFDEARNTKLIAGLINMETYPAWVKFLQQRREQGVSKREPLRSKLPELI